MTTQDFAQRLDEVAASIEVELGRLLSAERLQGELARPARLMEAIRYASLGGGKRLRPFLVLETARMLGVETSGTLRAACAVEMVHCYSLVHDDLPAMDDDDLRRGRPTVHRAFDEATAILAGDSLLTFAFDVLADPLTDADPLVRSELVLRLARASGLGGMAGGQALDLEAEMATAPLSREEVELLQAMKTGALLSASVGMGAIIGRADATQRTSLDRYGRALGAAFQIADDILDVTAETATLGKRAGKDAGRNKGTLVSILGLEGAQSVCSRFVAQAKDALTSFGPRADVLRMAADFVSSRTH